MSRVLADPGCFTSLSPSSVKHGYDKAITDKAFQVDIVHAEESTPPLILRADRWATSSSHLSLDTVWVFVSLLPCDSGVGLMNQRDGEI